MIIRNILADIWEKIDSHEILLLNGPRQAGKTTLMKLIKEKLINDRLIKEEQIYWFDLEKSEDLLIWSNQTSVLSFLQVADQINQYYVFIDEFQQAKNIGSTLKVLHDHHPNFKLVITGSASWYLNIDESMAGRKRVFPIWPASFSEFLSLAKYRKVKIFYDLGLRQPAKISALETDLVNNALLDFLAYGGYPAVATAANKNEKEKIIAEIINSYILRDIQIYNHVANTLQVRKILTLLSDQTGSLLDINNLALNSGIGRAALINRIDLLQNTFIVNLIRPYFSNKIKELVKNPKIFLIDSGIRNSLMNNFSFLPRTKYFGKAVENFVFTELLKQNNDLRQLFFWRTKTGIEVDIVIKQADELIPIEIKSGDENNIPNGLYSFIKQYRPKNAYVLNWSVNKEINCENTKIHFRPIWFNNF